MSTGRRSQRASGSGRRDLVLLGATLALTVAFRSPGLATMPLWLDERLTLWTTELGILALLAGIGDIAHPPGYPALAGAALLLGDSEWLIRLPALAGGLCCVLVVFRLLRTLGYHAIAHLGSVCTAVSVYQIYYSQEARGYSWMSALTGLTLLLAIHHVRRPAPWRLAGCLTAALASCLFHYTAITGTAWLVAGLLSFDIVRALRRTLEGRTPVLVTWGTLLTLGLFVLYELRDNLFVLMNTIPADATTRLNVGPRFLAAHAALWLGLGSQNEKWAAVLLGAGALQVVIRAPRVGWLVLLAAIGPFIVLAILPWNSAYGARYAMAALVPVVVLCSVALAIPGELTGLVLRRWRVWSERLPCAVSALTVGAFIFAIVSAALQYVSHPAKIGALRTTSDLHMDHLALQSRVFPWLIRSRGQPARRYLMLRFGGARIPVSRWPVNKDVRSLIGPDQRPLAWSHSIYFRNPFADESIRIRVGESRDQTRGSVRIERPVTSESFVAFIEAKRLTASKTRALLIRFARAETKEPIAFQQVSWYCARRRVQVDVTIHSARLADARRYLDDVLARADCDPDS